MKNIFFDLDGTLINISEKYYKIYYDFIIKHYETYLSKKQFWQLKRKRAPLSKIIKDIKLHQTYKQFFLKQIEQKHYLQYDKLFAFTHQILKDIQRKKVKIFLITLRTKKSNLLWEINRFKLANFFKKIFTTTPSAFRPRENYSYKIKLLKNIAYRGDIIIGDSRADILCGKKLSLQTVAVLSGISNYQTLKSLNPDYIIRDIRSIDKLRIFKS